MSVDRLLEGRGLSKHFGATIALKDVDIDLNPGEVLALFGENGAGKSTLVGLLSGRLTPDSGTLLVSGDEVRFRGPRDAIRAGVSLVSQELAGCPDLTAAENVLIGGLPNTLGFSAPGAVARAAAALADQYDITVALDRNLSDLSLADRQLVEILKALSRDPRALLLDEPTASLSQDDSQLLLGQIRRLANSGPGIILITHRVREALQIADRCLVLRNGQVVVDAPATQVRVDDVVLAMLGEDADGDRRAYSLPTRAADTTPHAVGTEVLALRGWTADKPSPLRGIDLTLRAGEVVGVYGLRGSGIEALAAGLAGTAHAIDGEMRTHTHPQWRPCPTSPRDRAGLRIAFVPADRKGAGLALQMSILDNMMFPLRSGPNSRLGFRRIREERDASVGACRSFDVVARGVSQPVNELSGGNQQKVLIASRVEVDARIHVLHEPTRGVDIGARHAIHLKLRAIAQQGAGVLVITSDVDEVALVSDRVLVIERGRIASELTQDDITQDNILQAAAGAVHD